MSNLPDFEGLAMVAKVAEERSFAGAARALNVSVPTVSRAVSRLEERVGGRIFNRTSRSLALTDLGRSVAERAARIYADAEEAENSARDQSSRPRGTIRLAVPMSFGLRWVAPLMPAFLRLHPEIKIDLHLGDAQVDLVGDGFDAALRIAMLEESSLVVRRLCPIGRSVVASPSYVARYGQPQHPGELRAHHCLGYALKPTRDVWHFTGADGTQVSVEPSGPLRVTNVDALVPTILDGMGIAELPEFIASEHLASGRFVEILPNWTLSSGGLYFVTPTARNRPAKVDALAAFLTPRLSAPQWRSRSPGNA